MLLAQPFDPFKEQQRKLPFFARCRIFSRTRRALSEFKNKLHENITNRHIQALMARDPRFMMATTTNVPPQQLALPPPPQPQQQPWYGGCCYDPYFNTAPPLMMLPPPLLAPPYPPMHPQQVPYCICVHLSSPSQSKMYYSPSSSLEESTLYSSSSSMYSNEKELIEEVEYPVHPLQETNYLTRRNSDILHDRQNTRRPSLHSRRWNTSDSNSVYYH